MAKEAATATTLCSASGCIKCIPDRRFFCERHWGRLSPELRQEVTDAVIDFRTGRPDSVPALNLALKMARRHLR